MEDSCNYPETSVSTVAKEMVTNEYVAQCYYPETLMTVAVEENIHPTASDRWFYPEVWVRSADTEDFARGESYTRYDFPSWGFSIAIPESFGTYHIRKIRFAYIDNPDEFWEHSISLVTHNGSLFNFYRTPLENVSNHPNFCPVRRVINIAETDAYQYRVGISPCSGGIMAGVNSNSWITRTAPEFEALFTRYYNFVLDSFELIEVDNTVNEFCFCLMPYNGFFQVCEN